MSLKRGISGRGRGGSPPLPRQRAALRVVQLTLLGAALVAAKLAAGAWQMASETVNDEVIGLGVASVLFAVVAAWMGFRTVRGPEPPSLD